MTRNRELEFTIITGMSGAGKSQAIHSFEDMGYFCIDNLPPQLLKDMAKLGSLPGSRIKKIAVVSDIRGGELFNELSAALSRLMKLGISYQILFLDASDEVLINRFKETRRRHPLSENGSIIEGIRKERKSLEKLKGQADMIIDTSHTSSAELRDRIVKSFIGELSSGMLITIMSFGFKYGMPLDADIVMDVRFIPNPHYVPELKILTGKDQPVREFVLKRKEATEFLERFKDMITMLLPFYVSEGKSHLTIAIGCTGGAHRSVVLTSEIASYLHNEGYNVTARHKDIGKDLKLVKGQR